ncbi:hypothetical protein KPL71_024069 [Citrus sinensis]|uniref:Uncharacterized protein n=1 Tax=Citrus sinensis TaxID=2711 RepID=A0ACB8INW4_CITSI|nr:hypothetical protein KPL71_024069 [Citrus sinensis]
MLNMSIVGVPPGHVQKLSKDKPLCGGKVVQIPTNLLDQAHLYILHNTQEVVPYISDHMDWLKTCYPHQNDKWLQEEHNRTFADWLADKVKKMRLIWIVLLSSKIDGIEFDGGDFNGAGWDGDDLDGIERDGANLVAPNVDVLESSNSRKCVNIGDGATELASFLYSDWRKSARNDDYDDDNELHAQKEPDNLGNTPRNATAAISRKTLRLNPSIPKDCANDERKRVGSSKKQLDFDYADGICEIHPENPTKKALLKKDKAKKNCSAAYEEHKECDTQAPEQSSDVAIIWEVIEACAYIGKKDCNDLLSMQALGVNAIQVYMARNRERREALQEQQLIMADEALHGNEDARPLRDYIVSIVNGAHSSIARPTVQANNFEIKSTIIQMIQTSVQFAEMPNDDPNAHIANFLEICDTFKLNGVSHNAIRLRLFPFSLRDKTKKWLNSLSTGTITTWNGLAQKFLAKYFPPTKTAKLRNDITTFAQFEMELLYEACETYKDLLRKCPHHGLPVWLQVYTFYNGLGSNTRTMIDAAAGGTLMGKTPKATYELLEEMASNNYQWSSERSMPRKTIGAHNIDVVTSLSEQMTTLSNKLEHLNVSAIQTQVCELCGGNHTNVTCQVGSHFASSSAEQAHYVSNFQRQ